jgi:hypothetical protein
MRFGAGEPSVGFDVVHAGFGQPHQRSAHAMRKRGDVNRHE